MLDGKQLGLALKERALDRYEGDPWLLNARVAARALLRWHPDRSVTIDDVQAAVGAPPRPNMAGSVFRVGFKRVGYTTSKKAHGHGNPIGKWVLA